MKKGKPTIKAVVIFMIATVFNCPMG